MRWLSNTIFIAFLLLVSQISYTKNIEPNSISIINRSINANVILSELRNENNLTVRNCEISGKLAWHDSIIGNLFIYQSVFLDTVSFSGSAFIKNAGFGGCEFKKYADFSYAIFDSAIEFTDNIMDANTYFEKAFFRSKSTFWRIKYLCHADFNQCQFCDTSITRFCKYKSADYNSTLFKKYCLLMDCDFGISVGFDGAKFDNAGDFSRLNFGNGADFFQATLLNVNIKDVDLSGSDFEEANLRGVRFEPSKIPEASKIAYCSNLQTLYFQENPTALTMLRDSFKTSGFREQERGITYALKRSENKIRLEHARVDSFFNFRDFNWDKFGPKIERISFAEKAINYFWYAFNLALFDWTVQYGMNYTRPIVLTIIIIIFSAFLYLILICLNIPGNIEVINNSNSENYAPLKEYIIKDNIILKILIIFRYCLVFSMMNATNISFREFNFSRWLYLLFTEDVNIRPTGWIRPISAFQSIISLFLLILFLLSYFGRPFG
jgi:uncharacterized protein YjbI with pentapeptide repeats